jgi:hypothetical protein
VNETFYRIICDRCGKVTVTPLVMDCSRFLYRDPGTGMDHWLRLCPEHLAQWHRLLSDFLEGLI